MTEQQEGAAASGDPKAANFRALNRRRIRRRRNVGLALVALIATSSTTDRTGVSSRAWEPGSHQP